MRVPHHPHLSPHSLIPLFLIRVCHLVFLREVPNLNIFLVYFLRFGMGKEVGFVVYACDFSFMWFFIFFPHFPLG